MSDAIFKLLIILTLIGFATWGFLMGLFIGATYL